MNKKLLRKEMQLKRDALSFLEVQGRSHEVTQRLLYLPAYKKAQTIVTYLAFGKELQTEALIQTAWQQKKRILVPVCQPATKTLLLSELKSLKELGPGTWGIPEPLPPYVRPVSSSEVDLVILPGLAFDRHGFRLGYGAGYFDRFLPTLPQDCLKVAVAYDFQLIEELPREAHDVAVDLIVTENRLVHTH